MKKIVRAPLERKRDAAQIEDDINRLGFRPNPDAPSSQTNPVKAIRRHCIDCSGGSVKMAEECPSSTCNLFPFRLGFNPYRRVRSTGKAETPILEDDNGL